MDNREKAGVRRAIEWLHVEARRMNDPKAKGILNDAAFHLGVALKYGEIPKEHNALARPEDQA